MLLLDLLVFVTVEGLVPPVVPHILNYTGAPKRLLLFLLSLDGWLLYPSGASVVLHLPQDLKHAGGTVLGTTWWWLPWGRRCNRQLLLLLLVALGQGRTLHVAGGIGGVGQGCHAIRAPLHLRLTLHKSHAYRATAHIVTHCIHAAGCPDRAPVRQDPPDACAPAGTFEVHGSSNCSVFGLLAAVADSTTT